MRKVFLYLYPIREYITMFTFHNDKLYEEWGIKSPLPIINETIDKRYRQNGYEIIIATYPDKKIYGIDIKDSDKLIFTDVTFEQATGYHIDGSEKEEDEIIYPSEEYLLNLIGNTDSLVIGGFHFSDCVKRVAKYASSIGIDVLVDLDLTDLFFGLYRDQEYFDVTSYDPKRFKEFITEKLLSRGDTNEFIERQFNFMYGDPIFGMPQTTKKR